MSCARCSPQKLPQDFYSHISELEQVTSLLDDSHFMLNIKKCPACQQQYADVWTEFIDWNEGKDAQYSTVIPISDDEAARLIASERQPDLRWLSSLTEGRRKLVLDYPTGKDSRYEWRDGPVMLSYGW